jgi:hypothetical protein
VKELVRSLFSSNHPLLPSPIEEKDIVSADRERERMEREKERERERGRKGERSIGR